MQNESPLPGVRASIDIESGQLLPFDVRDEPFEAPFESVFSWESDQMKTVQLWRAHKYLAGIGAPVLVVSFADLIWRPDYTLRRLPAFVPCLHQLDINYSPRAHKGTDIFPENRWKAYGSLHQLDINYSPRAHKGTDIFPENRWKAYGSVRQFGRRTDPERFGYDAKRRQCATPTFSKSIEDSLEPLTSYLFSFS
eukprot:UN2296